jgi:hypothetical protein
MKKTFLMATGALAIAGLGATTLSAHHSFAMFEMDRNVRYEGKITEWKWMNPHVHFTVHVPAGPGVNPITVGTWDVEGGSINIMGRQGWTRSTFKVGDPVVLVGHPMRDGSKGISLFYVIMPDGRRLYHDIARPGPDHKVE